MADGKVAVTEEEQEQQEKRIGERDRRVHVALVAMIVAMFVIFVVASFSILRSTYLPSGEIYPALGNIRVEVPRAQWRRFFDATDRFAQAHGFVSVEREIGVPVTKETTRIMLGYRRDGGTWMSVDTPSSDEFHVYFHDKAGSGEWRQVAADFIEKVVEANDFKPKPE
jgi:catechol 2,3-dioxygenase-like lactoylglutathione lyase family enzyme